LNQRHNWLRATSHQADDPRVALLHVELPLRTPRAGSCERIRSEFGPGAERPSIAPEDHDARGQAIVEPGKVGDKLVGHRWCHRIEGIRPIEGEDLNGVTRFDCDRREFVHVVRSQGHHSSPRQQDVTG
jgi:hypothetical protein